MGSRNGKILIGLIALCVVAGGAYVAVAALGPNQTTTDARPEAGVEYIFRVTLAITGSSPLRTGIL